MKTRKFIASAVVAGITLGGFTGLASVASATPQVEVTPNEVSSEAEELSSKSAIFRYQAPGDNPPMIYIAHLSEESRAAGSERSPVEDSAVTVSSLDIWGLALEQAPRSYFTWADAVKEHPSATEDIKWELNKLQDNLQKKDYAAAQETYAKTVATIMEEAIQREGEEKSKAGEKKSAEQERVEQAYKDELEKARPHQKLNIHLKHKKEAKENEAKQAEAKAERDKARSELPNSHSGVLPPFEVNLIIDGYVKDPVSDNIIWFKAQVAKDIRSEGKVKHVTGQAVTAYAIDSEGVAQQADKLGIN